jgi:hypothetical protein
MACITPRSTAPEDTSIVPSFIEATGDQVYVRFHGKNRENWFKRNITAAERTKAIDRSRHPPFRARARAATVYLYVAKRNGQGRCSANDAMETSQFGETTGDIASKVICSKIVVE